MLSIGDLDDVVTLVAPRPLLLCSATEDEYSADAPVIAEAAAATSRGAGRRPCAAARALRRRHALTEERFAAIVRWTAARAWAKSAYSV